MSFPARAVTRVSFAPDPKEDYVGSENPMLLCEATVEMDSGKQFYLILTEPDARRLHHLSLDLPDDDGDEA